MNSSGCLRKSCVSNQYFAFQGDSKSLPPSRFVYRRNSPQRIPSVKWNSPFLRFRPTFSYLPGVIRFPQLGLKAGQVSSNTRRLAVISFVLRTIPIFVKISWKKEPVKLPARLHLLYKLHRINSTYIYV